MIGKFSNVIKKGSDHIVFNAKLGHLIVSVFPTSIRDNILKYISNSLSLMLIVCISWKYSRTSLMSAACTSLILRILLRHAICTSHLLETWRGNITHWGVAKFGLGVDAAHFFLSSDLSDTCIDWADINVHNFDTLITVNVQFLIDHFWWSFNS